MSTGGKIGCVILGLVLGCLSFVMMGVAALGDCAPGVRCQGELGRALMLYGTPIASLAILVGYGFWARRN
jgi:hypothetical protein